MTILLASWICATCANATQVTLSYGGMITSGFYADCEAHDAGGSCTAWDNHDIAGTDFLYGQQVNVGDAFTGSFTYDPRTPLTAMSDDGRSAVYLGGVLGSELITGELRLPASLPRSGNGDVLVQNDGLNGYDSFYLSNAFSDAAFFATVTLDLMDSSGSVFDSFAVPVHAKLADFTAPYFHIALLRKSDGDQVHLYGQATWITVPEPSSLWLMLVGLFGVGFALRSHRRVRSLGLHP